MPLAVLAPLTAAACYGVASIVQQVGARRAAPAARRIGIGLIVDLVRQPWFLLGLGLDAIGFTLAFLGLRHLPVFVVQAAVSSTVAVTAVLGSRFLADRLSRREWALVAAVVLGLVAVGVSAAPGDRATLGWIGTAVLVAGVPALALAAVAAGGRTPAVLGALSGVGFAGFALAGRLLPAHAEAPGLLADPVLWAAVLYAVLGLGLYGAALQRGSVTAVTAAAIATEALFPSAVGLLLLSDRTRPGLGLVALAGFTLTVGAAVALALSKSAPEPADRREAPVRPGAASHSLSGC